MNLSAVPANRNFVSVRARVEKGVIEGLQDTTTGLKMYFGIPYARPPVGKLRWEPPKPAESWEGILETKDFGPRPIQIDVFGDLVYRSDNMSEDCLYLNIWTPAKKDSERLPVLLYFYGGGFVAGDGSEPRYDGASLAKKGIVMVTVNYRLNIFGFFAHPELSAESPYKGSGNYGLLDQNAALKWVQKNISAFGGNPEKITIAGESAGSISVSAHMASPLSKNIITGAIGESGAAIKPTLHPVPLKKAEEIGLNFAKKAGYKSLAELRNLSEKDLFDIYRKSKRFGFPLVIDGYFLSKTLPEIFNAEEQSQIPLLLGWNSAEIPGTGFMQGLPYTKENYIKKVKEAYPDKYERVLQLYPSVSKEEIRESATALASDRFIVYSTWKWFDLQRKNSSQPVYRYLFSKIRPESIKKDSFPETSSDTLGQELKELIGAPHASEIEYCLGNLKLIDNYPWTDKDYKVSKTMQNYFANFILTGNPNGEGLIKWPAVESNDTTPKVMIIDAKAKVIEAKNDIRYRFMDRIYRHKAK